MIYVTVFKILTYNCILNTFSWYFFTLAYNQENQQTEVMYV